MAAPEKFSSAVRVGLRHVRHSPRLRTVTWRSASFVVCSSSLWATLPLLCDQVYGFDSRGYGAMVGAFGLGAVIGAVGLLPALRRRFELNSIVSGGWLLFVGVLLSLSLLGGGWLPLLPMLVGGACWICILSNLHLVVQTTAPTLGSGSGHVDLSALLLRRRELRQLLVGRGGPADRTGPGAAGRRRSAALHLAGRAGGAAGLERSAEPGAVPRLGASRNDHGAAAGPRPHPGHGRVRDRPRGREPAFRQAAEKRLPLSRAGYASGGSSSTSPDPLPRGLSRRELGHLRAHARVTAYETEIASVVYAFHRGPTSPPVTHHAYCNQRFPAEENSSAPAPKVYPTTSRGVPLWFVDDLSTFESEPDAER